MTLHTPIHCLFSYSFLTFQLISRFRILNYQTSITPHAPLSLSVLLLLFIQTSVLLQQYRRDLLALLSRCGLCLDAAARYKGPQVGARGRRGGPVFSCPPPPNHHRGSVLTTVTSLEPIPNPQLRPRQAELLPLSLTVPNNAHSTSLHKPVAYF